MGIELYSNAPMPEEPAQLEPCWCAERRPTPAGEAAATAFYLDGAPLDDAAQAALRESAARYQARTDARARRESLGVPEIAYEGEQWGARHAWVGEVFAWNTARPPRSAAGLDALGDLAASLPPVPAALDCGEARDRARAGVLVDPPARPCATCGGAGCRVRPARPGLHCGPTAKPMLRALRTLPCDGGGHGEAEPARLLALLEAGPAARDGFLDPARAFVRDAIARGAALVYWT